MLKFSLQLFYQLRIQGSSLPTKWPKGNRWDLFLADLLKKNGLVIGLFHFHLSLSSGDTIQIVSGPTKSTFWYYFQLFVLTEKTKHGYQKYLPQKWEGWAQWKARGGSPALSLSLYIFSFWKRKKFKPHHPLIRWLETVVVKMSAGRSSEKNPRKCWKHL